MRRVPLLLLLLAVPAPSDEPLPEYGFRGFEIYKLTGGIFGLEAFDADGDGLTDLLLVNNDKARLDLLLRRREPVEPKAKIGQALANELTDDRFFERKEVLTEKQVSSVATGDFDGDGKRDVAFYGKPQELVVLRGDGKGDFAPLRTFDVADGSLARSALAAGDLSGDGRDDLVLLAKSHAYLFLQSAEGTLLEPAKVPNAAKELVGVGVFDLDGDGRKDLATFAPNDERSVRVRFQEPGGVLGPEIAFKTAPWSSLDVLDVDPRPGEETLVVQRTSGLLRALAVRRRPPGEGTGVPLGTVRIHPFEEGKGGKERGLALADVDGDGRVDVVATEPGSAQIGLYLQQADGRLGARRVFPSLSEAESVRVADLSGDGRPEICVLSSGEKAVAMSALDEGGRLPFPASLPVPGVPKAMDAGDLNGDGRADLVVVVEREKKRYVNVFLQKEAGGLGGPSEKPLEGMKDAPDDVLIHDLDRDGRADLLFVTAYGTAVAWRGVESGFEPVPDGASYRGGLVEKLAPGNVGVGDLDGDGKAELLVASQNFARAVVLGAGGGLEVLDQVNGRSPASRIRGVVVADLVGDGRPEVALYDEEGGVVTVLRRGASGVHEVAASFSAGRLAFVRLLARDMNGDGRTDLVLHGKEGFGIFYAGAEDLELEELHAFESPMRDARITEFAMGRIGGGPGPDLACIDVGNNAVEIVEYDPGSGFRHGIQWRVFEEKRHDGRPIGGRGEPREVVVADLDGDSRDDVAVVVHDRVIVYLGE